MKNGIGSISNLPRRARLWVIASVLVLACVLVIASVLVMPACLLLAIQQIEPPMFTDVEIFTCRDVQNDEPVSIAREFSDHETVCIVIKAKASDDAVKLLSGSETDAQLALTSTWYYEGQDEIAKMLVPLHDTPEVEKTGGVCLKPGDHPPRPGEYQVLITSGDTELGKVTYWVRPSP
jgi:hypothetical protein